MEPTPTGLKESDRLDEAALDVELLDEVEAGRSSTAGRKAKITMIIGMLAFPFIMVTMLYATYVGTMHAPQVRDLPIAVVATSGGSASTDALTDALAGIPDDQVETRHVADVAEARDLLERQEIAAAIVPPTADGRPATVLVAGASGASKTQTARQLVLPVTTGLGWAAEVEDIAPLGAGDTSGTSALFGGLAMMLAGYVPISIVMMGAPHLLRVRRFFPLAVAWAAVVSSVAWLVLGPIVGAVDGHYLAFLGIGTLAITAVASVQLFFTKVAGPLGVLLGMLFLVVLGTPASNLALPVEAMPGFFGLLHHVLPLPAAGEALRSVLYFDGTGVGQHLLVLAVGLVVGTVLSVLMERRKGDVIMTAPKVVDADTPLPALPGGPLRSKKTRYFAAAAFPGTMIILVISVMGASMHSPTLHEMPVAVVGPTAESTAQAVTGLGDGLGEVVDLTAMGSVEEAEEAIRSEEVVAAFVLPSTPDGSARLLTASGLGASQQTAATAVFTQVAAGQQMSLETEDVVPLTSSDRQGSNTMYIAMAWVMAGFLITAVLRGGAPFLRTLRQQLPVLGGWAVGMSVWLWVLFDVLIDAVDINAAAFIGVGALTIFAMSMAAGVFTRTIGMAAVPAVVLVLMLLGVPSSGGGVSVYMVPELFRSLHAVLPLPAAVDIVRSLTYLGGNGIGHDILVLTAWGVVGLLIGLVTDRWIVRRPAHPQPERNLPQR